MLMKNNITSYALQMSKAIARYLFANSCVLLLQRSLFTTYIHW